MKKRIVFVDDEQRVLDGLRRMLHSRRDEWQIDCIDNGESALEAMSSAPYDVIVTDMRMPKMDGLQLLKHVSKRHPQTIRFVLSGQSSAKVVLQTTGYAHRFLPKPCDTRTLKSAIDNSISLRKILSGEALKKRLSEVANLPTLSKTYNKLLGALQSESCSVKSIAEIACEDLGIITKLLRLANSALYGRAAGVTSPVEAISLLGLDTVRAVVLMAGTFDQLKCKALGGLSLETINTHSLTVGLAARRIAKALNLDGNMVEESLMSGLLHDIGKLVGLKFFRKELSEALFYASSLSISLFEAERLVSQFNHAEVGAYLLYLWGLPDNVVESTALHHNPMSAPSPTLNVLTAVHIANAFVNRSLQSDENQFPAELDMEYLNEVGVAEQVPRLLGLNSPE